MAMSLARAVHSPSVASRPHRPAARLVAPSVVVPLPPPAAAATPAEIEFWDFRYRTNRTPWDAGRAPNGVLQWIERNPPRRRHILIPGCGRGHEIFSFSGAGWNTTAIDVSPAAIEKVKRRANRALAKQIYCADFFTHAFNPGQFDVIYERAFLNALAPARWPEFVQRVATLLKPGGLLLGSIMFGECGAEPPHGLAEGEDRRLFEPGFMLLEEAPVGDSVPLFEGRERWQVWQKR